MTNAVHSHHHDHHDHDHHHHHGHGHDHGSGHHDHTSGATARSLLIALGLSGSVLAVELVGAFAFNSLALLSDAAHMMTDVAALAIALLAVRIGEKAPDDKRSFGYKRLEILAAAFNALLLFAAAAYVLVEAIGRFREPEPVAATGMMIVAGIALVANLISMRVLMAGRGESMAVRGAYLEVWADAVGALGVIIAALAIRLTGATWIDPIVAIGLSLWILPRTWSLLRDTVNILLEGTPRGIDLADIRRAIGDEPGVRDVHDLHVWSMSTSDINGSVHIAVEDDADGEDVRLAVADLLERRFAIGHATIQVERQPCAADARPHR
ncbi:cation diffusion facilitator family transporter [Sphingomonas nostoxanthinifaciens]|uniref:cation diffusion facilitator family transporter n=1 Tax=Sphingomonas nostoxanthinifaciens TaxID=2872652 RepID=UPI001CC1E4EA|nr:cation diffusion facilitator family transporter [Sphingomonas nostoxanthinifaciens]UAK26038.1 cation diffusion facilitator family transporter [Sphingomonas nostoxanthinifaciens]